MPSHAKPSATRKERKTMETEAWAPLEAIPRKMTIAVFFFFRLIFISLHFGTLNTLNSREKEIDNDQWTKENRDMVYGTRAG